MSSKSTEDRGLVQAVTAHCGAVLPPPDQWFAPKGWPDSLALCILDSIWSLGADYEGVVRPIIKRYREHRTAEGATPESDSAQDLVSVIERVGGAAAFAAQIANQRPAHSKPGAPLKAESVLRSAQMLVAEGIDSTSDLRSAVALPHAPLKAAWRGVPGNGPASWRYLLMLAGDEHIKPDRMVRRFVSSAPGVDTPTLTAVRAADLLSASATEQKVGLRVLDHTVWRYQSGLSRASSVVRSSVDLAG